MRILIDTEIARQLGVNAAIVFGFIESNGIKRVTDIDCLSHGQITSAIRSLWKAEMISNQEASLGREKAKPLKYKVKKPTHEFYTTKDGQVVSAELRLKLLGFNKDHPDLYDAEMYKEFLVYWSEPSKKGTPRWALQEFFHLGKRLATWAKNNKEKWERKEAQQPKGEVKVKVFTS